MNIVNLTPHKLVIFDEYGKLIQEIAPSGNVARIDAERKITRRLAGVPIFKTVLGQPEGLPDPISDTIFVVSGLFRSQCDREDLHQPGELMRDSAGQVIGCIGLSR